MCREFCMKVSRASPRMSSKPNMSSKPVRRKRPQLAKNDALDINIKAYQIVEGFTRCPVAADGNCFYTATGFFCGLNAAQMREHIMKYFIFKKSEYSIFFESENDFMKAVEANCSPRVWNSELCDIAPHAAAQLLKRTIVIHNYNGSIITEITTPVEIPSVGPPLHLFRSNDHYEILLDNTKNPDKNLWPLPDISEFSGKIDLRQIFRDPSDDEVEESEPEVVTDKCMIRF